MTTYKEAGVNIEAGEKLVDDIKPLVKETFTEGVLGNIGAFGAFYDLSVLKDYEAPVLVSSVDGVGTKLMVAVAANRHHTVGQDLVNHCVNDIAVCGAVPLYFMDYFATGTLEPNVAREVIRGFAIACKENDCALVGGETAEMPDMYRPGEYDLAGTIVGVVDRNSILDGKRVQHGDRLIGLPSTGLHTNGYSLARKVLLERWSVSDTPSALDGQTIGDAMLAIHRSYLDAIQAGIKADALAACAHITGGGISGNLPRALPAGFDYEIDFQAWTPPPLFELIAKTGNVPEEDMRRTFNLGIGLIMVSPESKTSELMELLSGLGESPLELGFVK